MLDYGTRQLLVDGDEIHLSPKAFELLAILLDNRPRAVSKAELQERLWPSTFVEETNLAGLVAEIRRALGDSATRPVFLRTVYRFGYRFVGEVVESDAATRAAPSGPRPCLVFENRQARAAGRRQRHRPRAGRDDPVRCHRRVAAPRAHSRVEGGGDAGRSGKQERHVSAEASASRPLACRTATRFVLARPA